MATNTRIPEMSGTSGETRSSSQLPAGSAAVKSDSAMRSDARTVTQPGKRAVTAAGKVARTARQALKRSAKPPIIWSIAGGKGGTGKSVVAANLGLAMALLGHRVILIDGDLGGPNLHNYLNLRRPPHTLNDFIANRVSSLDSVLMSTPLEKLRVISGGVELLGTANLNHAKKEKMLRHIQGLDADYVIVDLGAGTTFNTIDFFNLSSRGFIIANPEPNAKYDAFFFLKNAVFRRLSRKLGKTSAGGQLLTAYLREREGKSVEIAGFLERLATELPKTHADIYHMLQECRPTLIMNKVRNRKQRREGDWFVNLVKNYLGIDMEYAGHISQDAKVVACAEEIVPFLFKYPKCKASRDLYNLLTRLRVTPQEGFGQSFRQFRWEVKRHSAHWLG